MGTTHKKAKHKVGKTGNTQPKHRMGVGNPLKAVRRMISKADNRGPQALRASTLFRQVSDPTRIAILVSLSKKERNVEELRISLEESQQKVSHHLALLRHNGLIAPRRVGNKNYYQSTDLGRNFVNGIERLMSSHEPEISKKTLEAQREDTARKLVDHEQPERSSPASRIVHSGESPRKVRSEVQAPRSTAYVLEFFVGGATGDFIDFESVILWVKEYREAKSIHPDSRLPIFIVFSSISNIPTELTIELGAVVIDRNGREADALREWIDQLPKPESPNSTSDWLRSEEVRLPENPSESDEIFGRQPAHISPFDEEQFSKMLLGINQTPWWSLDY